MPATEAVPPDTFSLFDSSLPVTGTLFNDGGPIELGVKFRAAQAGTITELKYYRAAGDAGDVDIREGHLWSSNGTLIATVTFNSGMGDDGWQVASLANPVAILANTDYIVSYRTNDNYIGANLFFDPAGEVAYDGVDDDAFTDPFGILSAPQNTVVGDAGVNGNGIYKYGSTVVMPDQTYKSSNYWVDVTFDPADGPNNAPVFTSNGGGNTAVTSIAENTTAVTTVTASDPDVGQTLIYSISGGADESKFTIDATTGALSFITAPNFELPADADGNNIYDVIVQVSDGQGGVDTQTIAVTVTDFFENTTPIITSNGGGNTAVTSIAENTTAVTTVTASDPDVGQALIYSISGGADESKFTIDATTGALSFITAPNFELPADADGNNIYDVIVQVSDGQGGVDTQTIAVTVTDFFENTTPIITSNGGGNTAVTSIAENTTAVTTVTASDPDVGQALIYSISGGADESKFTIDATTGALSFITAPNFELPADADGNNIYDVIVQVSDGQGGVDTQTIAVTVTDFFENTTPIITSNGGDNTAAVSLAENTTAVTTVTASDPDIGQTRSYSISGGADESKFTIDATTGALSFITAPNFETPTDAGGNNVYDLTVQVSDGHGGIDIQAIAVTVTDVFENLAPIITSDGGSDTAAISISENSTAVTTVTASDPDVGQTLSYSISGGADAFKFKIGATTGALSFVTAPNFETPTDAGGNNVYDVIVQASDGHGGIGTQAIAVSVQDVTETPHVPTHEISRVERFFDSATGDHFYTLSPAEADHIRATLPTYHDEGAPWGTPDKGADTIDVFRFFDVATGAHFLTSSTAERDHVMATLPSYHYEGVAFEAYNAPGEGTLTLERFFNTQTHLHHYAASEAEIASILSGGAGPGWVDEGAGFIVHA